MDLWRVTALSMCMLVGGLGCVLSAYMPPSSNAWRKTATATAFPPPPFAFMLDPTPTRPVPTAIPVKKWEVYKPFPTPWVRRHLYCRLSATDCYEPDNAHVPYQ